MVDMMPWTKSMDLKAVHCHSSCRAATDSAKKLKPLATCLMPALGTEPCAEGDLLRLTAAGPNPLSG